MNVGGNLETLADDLLGSGKQNDADDLAADNHEAEAALGSPFEGLEEITPEMRDNIIGALEEAEATGMTADIGDNVGGLAEDVSDAMKDIGDNLSHMSESMSETFNNMNISEAAQTLRENLPLMREELASKVEDGSITHEEAHLSEIVNSPMPPVLLKSLQDGGVNDIDLTDMPMDTPSERVQSVLEASANAHTENKLPSPQAEIDAAYEAHAHEAVHVQQQSPEYDYTQTHEEDHSAGL